MAKVASKRIVYELDTTHVVGSYATSKIPPVSTGTMQAAQLPLLVFALFPALAWASVTASRSPPVPELQIPRLG